VENIVDVAEALIAPVASAEAMADAAVQAGALTVSATSFPPGGGAHVVTGCPTDNSLELAGKVRLVGVSE